MDIERISEMEGYLRECTEASEALNRELDRMEQIRDHMIRLFRYYGSEEWDLDREGDLPEGVPAGVLSEDLVFDQITDIRDAAFRMMETGTDILKNRI